MKTTPDNNSPTIPPALLAEIEAEAEIGHLPVAEMLRSVVEHGLEEVRWQRTLMDDREAILARVDAAEASLARGDGIPITQASMRQLAADVKQRGRARLDAEN